MSGTQGAFLKSLGDAADELGYGIKYIDESRVELQPTAQGAPPHTVTIEYRYFLINGDDLRRILRPLHEPAS